MWIWVSSLLVKGGRGGGLRPLPLWEVQCTDWALALVGQNRADTPLHSLNKEFDKVRPVKETSLKDGSYFASLSFENFNTWNAQRNWNPKGYIVNPPYIQKGKTNNIKLFIKFVRKCFIKYSKHRKIFSLNIFKLSYCFTTNVGNITKRYNAEVGKKINYNNRQWNCWSKPNCSLNG